jgi:hypothetical protein
MRGNKNPYKPLENLFLIIFLTLSYFGGVVFIDTVLRPILENNRLPVEVILVLRVWAIIFVLLQILILWRSVVGFGREVLYLFWDVCSFLGDRFKELYRYVKRQNQPPPKQSTSADGDSK